MTATAARRTFGTRIPITLIVPVVATVGAVLSLVRAQPLSWDEAVSVAIASRPVGAILVTLHHSDAVLGAYYLLLHAWVCVPASLGLHAAEWWWRLPSAVAAVVTCVVAASCARRLAGPAAGVLAGSLLAVLPLFAFYTVDARPYTLAALTATSAWWVWTRPGTSRPLQHATTVLLLVTAAWLQLFTVLVWPAFLLVARSYGSGPHARRRPRRGLLVLTAATIGVIPLLWIAIGQSGEIAWVAPADLANTVGVALHVGGGLAVVALGAVLLVLAGRAGLLTRGPTAAAVLWWTCAPFALLAALDVVRPVLVARYALASLPLVAVGFGVLVTRGSTRVGANPLRLAAAAVVVAAVATSTWQGSRPWKYEDYRGAAAFAGQAETAGTPVLFAPSSARLGFYLYAGSSRLHDLALPGGVGADPLAITEKPSLLLRELVGASCSVVLVGASPNGAVADLSVADRAKVDMVSGWSVDAGRDFGQISVTVLDNPACGEPAPDGT